MSDLSHSVFLRQLAKRIAAQVAPAAHPLSVEPHSRILKLWYGKEQAIHYEVALHEQSRLLEFGLHCEAEPKHNELIMRGFAAELFEIKHRLGLRVELEPWDRGWVRVYETHDLYPLNEQRLGEMSERCVFFINQLQPIYESIAQNTMFAIRAMNISGRTDE